MINEQLYSKYVAILKEELVPAMGCTEPVAIAYAGALARDTLGEMPISAELLVSGNIIKNVKSVVVPNTAGLKGIENALAAGILFGETDKELEVIANAPRSELSKIPKFRNSCPITVDRSDSSSVFDIQITLSSSDHTSYVRILDDHTNVVCIKKDGAVLFERNASKKAEKVSRDELTVKDIVDFADNVKIEDVKDVLERQIKYNMAIADEGIKNNYGANIGKVILNSYINDVKIKAKAYAAAASDARMNGCELPVIINSGSGNQGITASVPVIVYANELCVPKEKLYRALCVSNLVTIHLKSGIGTLSAYCGVVSAGAGAGCGIAYLLSGDYKVISHTLVNALAMDSGVICDGAKASCAAKIAIAVESGILGLEMYYQGNEFYAGDGIVKKGVEQTIMSVSRLAQDGMKETDKEIISIMIDETC